MSRVRKKPASKGQGVHEDAIYGLLQNTTTAERASILLALCRMLRATRFKASLKTRTFPNWQKWLKEAGLGPCNQALNEYRKGA